jgi:predicted transcriptional regulator|tara:strand:- start:2187 stop:2618 length:432 start_codon:yes stop_codon:yes gene_type:complete
MESKNLKNKGNLHYYFFKDGTRIKRWELVNLILDLFENNDKLIIPEIVEKINMDEKTITHIIRQLCTRQLLNKKATNRHTLYFKKIDCPLAQIFYPKTIINKFKIKNRKSYKAEDFKNISHGGTKGYENFSSNFVNTIYEGGE